MQKTIINEDQDNLNENNIIKYFEDKGTTNFPSYCHICQKFPIQNIMFYCINCDTNFCEDCEKILGNNHRHCYYKIKNIKQYEEVLDVKIDEWNKNKNEKKMIL